MNARLLKGKLFLFFIFSTTSIFSQVVINEIQTSNLASIADEFSQYDDWIELYNAGTSAVNLNGYGLSQDSLTPYKFKFPDYTLAAGGYVLVFTGDTNKTIINTHWETAVKAGDTWKYRANTSAPPATNWRDPAFNDASWSSGTGGIGFGDSDDGTTVSTCVSVYMRKTFTVADTSKLYEAVFNMDYDDGYVAYLNGVEIARTNIGTRGVFPAWNDIAPAAYEALLYQNKYPDSTHLDLASLRTLLVPGNNVLAVETHNQSASNTDLSSNPFLSFSVASGSSFFGAVPSWFHYAAKTYFHTTFKLSKTGETIFLTNAGGSLIDKKGTGIIGTDNSIMRIPDGSANWCFVERPTPGTTNNSSVCGTSYTTIPIFSLSGGFYTGTQSLVLSTSFPGGVIRYTTNGSDVTSSSPLYSSPIQLSTSKTVRARVFAPNAVSGPAITHTYLINFTCRLPVYALTTDSTNLYDYNTGIFVDGPGAETASPHFGANYWLDMEKPVTLEYYERDKSMQFQFNAGLAITGGWSRMAPQKNLEIILGDKYGLSSLNYSLESDKPWIDKWDDFVLHATGNDRDKAHMRDPLMNRLLHNTHCDYLAYEPCIVILNGQNWGVYYTRENDDHNWVKENYGYKSSEIDFLKESYFYPGIEVKQGSDSAYFAMYNYAVNTSPTDTGYYNTISSMMDLENMADYFIAETYYPNDDWMDGGNNNLKLWRPRKSDGKFRYLIYDLDFGLGLSGTVTNDMLAKALNPNPHNYNSDLFDAFTHNPAYKRYFINRYADLINTIFLPSNIQSMAYLFRDSIKYDMHLQFSKWGASDSSSWISNIASMMTFANQRPANARNFIQSDYQMNGQVTLTLQVSPAGAGTIQISTINPATYPWNGVYFNGNPVTITAIPNPGYTFDHWRSTSTITSNDLNKSTTYNFASNDAITCYFTGSSQPVNIAFSEINYHSDSIADQGDWIELHNRGSYTMDMSNWKFRDEADNHTFNIPVGTTIPANGYLVIASDLVKFKAVNPSVSNVVGSCGFDFSNNGEQLRLFDKSDALYASVMYSDVTPWTTQPDGNGYTLERLNETLTADDGNNWFAGCIGGSPGRAYSAPAVTMNVPSSSTICAGSQVTLNANGNGNFQWQRNHVDITGATSSSYDATQAGTYTVKLTANGCSNVSDSVVLTVHAVEQVTAVTPASRCGNGTVSLSATGTSALNWYADSVSSAILFSGNNFITPSLSQNTNYYVMASGACPSARTVVAAIVNNIAATPVVQNGERCGQGTVTLSATDTATVRWYDASTGGNLLMTGNIFTTPAITQNTTYFAEAGSVCASARASATATIDPVTASPVVTNADRCGPGTLSLSASDTATVRWYDAASGGNLLFSGNNFTTSSLATTTTYYAEAGSFCTSARVAAIATINDVSAVPVTQDASRCGDGSVTLQASASSPLNWYDSQSGGNLLASGNNFLTPSLNQNATYYVEAGVLCPSARVAVNVTINAITADPAVNDASRCGPGTVTLTANSSSVINWFDVASGGTSLATGNNFTTQVLTQSTQYYAQAGTLCPSNIVAVMAIINSVSQDPATNDISSCGQASITLNATSTDSLSWFDAPNGNLLATGNSYSTPVLTQSTTYYVQAGGICPGSFIPAEAIINMITAEPVVTDASACGVASLTLTASSSHTINWFDVPGGNVLFTGASFQTPVLNASAIYYAVAGDTCPSNAVAVNANIYTLPFVSLGADTSFESGTGVTLDAGNNFASYLWSTSEITSSIYVVQTGFYSVTVTDVNGCTASDDIQVSVVSVLASLTQDAGFEIFPSPVTDHAIVSLPVSQTGWNVTVLSADGKALMSLRAEKAVQKISIPSAGFASGVYFIRIENARQMMVKRVVFSDR